MLWNNTVIKIRTILILVTRTRSCTPHSYISDFLFNKISYVLKVPLVLWAVHAKTTKMTTVIFVIWMLSTHLLRAWVYQALKLYNMNGNKFILYPYSPYWWIHITEFRVKTEISFISQDYNQNNVIPIPIQWNCCGNYCLFFPFLSFERW